MDTPFVRIGQYGLLAEFDSPERVLEAARRAYDAGYRVMDAYTPFPVEGLAETLGHRKTRVPVIVFIGGLIGGMAGYFMQYFAMAIHYPVNVGGRPLHSWPAFIPITFETTVLCAALSAVIGMLLLNGFPLPYHPLFNVPQFEHATLDRFFLCIASADPRFGHEETRKFMEQLGALSVATVPF